MTGAVLPFPRRFRHPLPPDAICTKGRHVVVCPHEGAWAFFESDDGGGELEFELTKREAVYRALEWVLEFNATLVVSHAPQFEGPL